MTSYNLPNVKPWIQQVGSALGNLFGIKTIGGWRASDPISQDHPNGVALDFMTTTGTALAEYAKTNAKTLGVKYIVWNRHIWSQARASEGWRPYTGSSNPHTDHVHITFNETPPAGGSLTGSIQNVAQTGLGSLFSLDQLMGKIRGTSVTLAAGLLGVALVGVGMFVLVRQRTATEVRKILA